MSDDILEELEEEILYASRKAWDSAQSGLNANFLGRVQDEIERLRAENEKLRAELREADAMLLKQARTIRELSNGRYGQ